MNLVVRFARRRSCDRHQQRLQPAEPRRVRLHQADLARSGDAGIRGSASPSTRTASVSIPSARPRAASMSSRGTRALSRRRGLRDPQARERQLRGGHRGFARRQVARAPCTCWARSSTPSTLRRARGEDGRPARRAPIRSPSLPTPPPSTCPCGRLPVSSSTRPISPLRHEIEVGEHPNAMAFSKDGARLRGLRQYERGLEHRPREGLRDRADRHRSLPEDAPGSTPNALDLSPDGKTSLSQTPTTTRWR